jgi:hypothetical protein
MMNLLNVWCSAVRYAQRFSLSGTWRELRGIALSVSLNQQRKSTFVTPHTLKMATAVIMLAFAARVVAQARGANFLWRGIRLRHYHQAQAQAQHHYTMRYSGVPKSPMERSAD